MSIQGRSTSDSRNLPAWDRETASSGEPPRAAKRIAGTRWSHSIGLRFSALAAVATFALVGCSHEKSTITAEPLPRAQSGVLHAADADALAAATADAATAHAAREPGAHSSTVSMKHATASAPRHWITARSTVWLPEVDAMGQHLAVADKAIVDKDAPRAQWQLDEAADALQLDGGSKGAVHDLRAMAARVGQLQWPKPHAFNLMLVEANNADPHHGWGTRMPYAAYVELPLRQIRRAEDSYASGRRLLAARALRDAAVYVDHAAHRAPAEAQDPLYASAVQLRRVAARLETSTVPVSAALKRAARRATAGLANAHAVRARALWRAHDEAAAGRELQAATLCLHESATYGAGHVDQQVIDQARQLSSQLLAHARVSAALVDSRISALDRAIGKVRGTSARRSS